MLAYFLINSESIVKKKSNFHDEQNLPKRDIWERKNLVITEKITVFKLHCN